MNFSGHVQYRSSPALRRWRRFARCIALAMPFGRLFFPAAASLPIVRHDRPEGAPPTTLLVFLPGIHDGSDEVFVRLLIHHAWEAGLDADAVEVDLHLGYYLRQFMVQRLREDVIEPARARGYSRVWLVGMSLGGMGALAYAHAYPSGIEGVVLLGPNLGHRRFVEGWRAPCAEYQAPEPKEFQHELWEWLAAPAMKPPIYLGFGSDDKYSPCHRLMAELLPKGRVFVTPGSHDWPTWSRLWEIIVPRVITHPRHWA